MNLLKLTSPNSFTRAFQSAPKFLLLPLLFICFTSTYGATPTVQASNLSVSARGCHKLTVAFTRGNGTRSFITCRPAGQTEVIPTDGMNYSANTNFKSGTHLGNDNYSIFYTKGSQITIYGLQAREKYTVEIYEWDSTSKMYLTSVDASITDSTHFMEAMPTASLLNGDSCSKTAIAVFKANALASFQITAYTWSFLGKYDTTTADSFVKRVVKGGTHQYYVMPLPKMDCYQSNFTGAGSIFVIPTPKLAPFLDPPGPCLKNSAFSFDDSTSIDPVPKCAYYRMWDFGNGDKSTSKSGTRTYAVPRYIEIKYFSHTYYDGKTTGCADSMVLNKIGGPGFVFPTYPCLKSGDSVKVPSPINAEKYLWDNTDSNSFIWVKQPSSHILKVTDSNQCSYSDTVFIKACAPSNVKTPFAKNETGLVVRTHSSEIELVNNASKMQEVIVYSPDGRAQGIFPVPSNEQRRVNLKPGLYLIGNKEYKFQWYIVP